MREELELSGPADRVDIWNDHSDTLCPDRLSRLFTAGLTSADIGELYDLDRRRISQLAQEWGLCSRSLRAAGRSLIELRPDLAREFVADVSGRSRQQGPGELTLGSGIRVAWRCGTCAHLWQTSISNRALRGSGCPNCARSRLRDEALRNRARTASLAFLRPDLAGEFVRNLSVPDRDAHTTPVGSHDRIIWRCSAGHEWTTSARQRVKFRTHCPRCRGGLYRSRLEYEVAELLMAATGHDVTVGHEEPRTDRAGVEKVDLRVDDIDLLVDLDPSRWHRSASAAYRDGNKLWRLAGRRYVRFRPKRLGPLLDPSGELLDGQRVVEIATETDAWAWVSAILPVLRQYAGSAQTNFDGALTPAAKAEALGRAGRRWSALNQHRDRPTLHSKHPRIAAEFVAVPERAGLTAADLAPAGNDRVLWRCATCGHEWIATTGNRTVLGTGCPPCGYRAGSHRRARPKPGDSFADRHPGLTQHFVENVTRPGVGLEQMRPNSTNTCRWRCPHCGSPWLAQPQQLNRQPSGGCRTCSARRTIATRRARSDAVDDPLPEAPSLD
jgi:predicted  nucleic acid-binding Zn-ribbon protein